MLPGAADILYNLGLWLLPADNILCDLGLWLLLADNILDAFGTGRFLINALGGLGAADDEFGGVIYSSVSLLILRRYRSILVISRIK